MKISVVKATPLDANVIFYLTKQIWKHNFPKFLSNAQIDYMLGYLKSEKKIRIKLSDDSVNFFLIRDGERAIGYYSYGTDSTHNIMRFNEMYILPEYQNKGIGSFVFKSEVESFRNQKITEIIVYLNKNNKQSLFACQKHGFDFLKSVKIDIGNEFYLDDYIMIKNLEGKNETYS